MPESVPGDGERAGAAPVGVRLVLVVVAALLAVPLAAVSLAAVRAVPADGPRLVAATPEVLPLPPGVRRADLALAVRSVPVAPVAGLPITYTLDVTSRGPDPTGRTTVVDTLPPGFAFRSATAPPGTRCTPAGGVVTCVGPGLRPGGSRSISITALVDGRAPATTLVHSARVSSDLPDPVARNGVALDAPRVSRDADLVAAAVAPATAVVPGTRTTLGAAVTNRGPATADGVVLGVVVPAGATVVSADVAGGRCTTGGADVTCSVAAPLPPRARVDARVVVAVGAELVGNAVAHTVTATSLTPDPRAVGSTAVARTPVARSAALQTTTSGPAALVAGASGTWTTVVTNRGPSTARDVTVAGAARGVTVTDVDASSGTCTPARCTLGSLAPGESARITTLAAVPAGAPAGPARLTTRTDSSTPGPADGAVPPAGTVPPAGAATPDGAVPPDGAAAPDGAALPDEAGLREEADRADRSAPPGLAAPDVTTTTGGDGTAATTAVSGLADLAVAVSQGRPADLGGTLDLAADFTLRARNLGPSDATDAVLTAALPSGLRARAVPPGCAFDGARVTCRYPRIPVGTEVAAVVSTSQLPGVLPALLTGPRQLTAAVTSAVPDPVPRNDAGTAAPGPTLGGPDLAVVATDGAPRPVAGEVVSRTLTVTNRGTAAARNVVLDDAAVPGVTPVALPASCRASAAGTSCALGPLAPGASRAVTLAARLAPDRPAGPLARSSAVRLAGDPSPSDNVTSSSVPVEARADLRTTTTRVGGGPLLAGGPPVTYRVRTTNAGPSVAPGVVVDLDAPASGRRVLAASVPGGRCQVRATSALCRVATMAPGEVTEALVTVAAGGDLTGDATEMTATAASTVVDPTADDARAVEPTPVSRAVDLRTRVEAEPAAAAAGTVTAGSPTTVRATLTDVGPSTAAGAVLSSTLSPGTRALSATSTRGACAIAGGRVDCPVGDLPAGGTATATIVAEPAPGARGPFVVTATGTAATPGPAAPSTLSLGVAPAPAPPEVRLADAEAAGLDPGVGNPSGPGEGLTIAARVGRLPGSDVLALVAAGVALPAVVAALALRRRRSGRPARRARA